MAQWWSIGLLIGRHLSLIPWWGGANLCVCERSCSHLLWKSKPHSWWYGHTEILHTLCSTPKYRMWLPKWQGEYVNKCHPKWVYLLWREERRRRRRRAFLWQSWSNCPSGCCWMVCLCSDGLFVQQCLTVLFLFLFFVPLKGGREFLMSPHCLESGLSVWSHYIISPLLFFCLVLLLFLSYPFLLLAHSPDLFFLKLLFSKRYALLCGFCLFVVFWAVRRLVL